MRNSLFVVLFFVTGCFSQVQPSGYTCEEFCTALEEDGCMQWRCTATCDRGQELLTMLECEQESQAVFACYIESENACVAVDTEACASELQQLRACHTQGMCEDVCAAQSQNGCGAVDCVQDCVANTELAREQWCTPDWSAWVACEIDSTSCGECDAQLAQFRSCGMSAS